MAYTDADLATIREAIASGVTKVRFADGRELQRQTAEELLKVEQRIMSALASQSGAGRRRRRAAGWRNGC